MEKSTKIVRCKANCGTTLSWTIWKNKEGKFKLISVGKPGPVIPLDFLPFSIMDAVYNKNMIFDTLEAAEEYVRSL